MPAFPRLSKEFTVVATSTKTTSESVNDVPALAQKFREQLIATVQQSQKVSVDAAQTWVKAVSALPGFRYADSLDLPKPLIPGLPAIPSVEAATKFTFDVAADLLSAQRDFALQLAGTFAPGKTS
jgi:hypothetical protein